MPTMKKVKILGKILPEVFKVTIGYNPSIKWKVEEIGLDLIFNYKIENSIIEITCDIEKWQEDFSVHVYKMAYDIVRTAVNLVTFSTGSVFQISFERLIDPDGKETSIAIMYPELSALCRSYSLNKASGEKNEAFDNIFNIVLSDPTLFLALNDLCSAISTHDQTVIGCARVLESIRLLIWGEDTKTDKERTNSWIKLQDTLNIGKDYMKFITDNSTGWRHGSRKFIPGDITTEITKRSWVIMNRYFELRLRKITRLPVADFPLLS